MKALNDALQKIDAMTLRERAILFVVLLGGIWALLDAVLLAPQERIRKEEQAKVTQARSKLFDAEQAQVLHASQPDPDLAARKRLENARLTLNARMQTAVRLQDRMVAPKNMAQALQGLLLELPGLRLRSLETMPPAPVGLPPPVKAPAGAQPAKADEAALFKHGVTLTLVGNYAALTQYMEKLEHLPVGFYWASATLDASAHPEISLTLTLFTLSLERTWLTV
jgi:MSHA biogenesis protein MshJ